METRKKSGLVAGHLEGVGLARTSGTEALQEPAPPPRECIVFRHSLVPFEICHFSRGPHRTSSAC
jgi:hypothetical protein